jgi:3-oxoacyl-(acyl-carrier-protein) synthase
VYARIAAEVDLTLPSPLYDWPESAGGMRRNDDDSFPTEDVGLVCGSANSSRRLDACELDLWTRWLGMSARGVTVTSIKGATGEFGAAGALGAAALCLAVHEQVVPPLCQLHRPEGESPLRFAGPRGEKQPIDRALLCGIARGGAGLVLSLVGA